MDLAALLLKGPLPEGQHHLSRIERHPSPRNPTSHQLCFQKGIVGASSHRHCDIALTAAAPAPHTDIERFQHLPSPASRPPHHPTITTSLVGGESFSPAHLRTTTAHHSAQALTLLLVARIVPSKYLIGHYVCGTRDTRLACSTGDERSAQWRSQSCQSSVYPVASTSGSSASLSTLTRASPAATPALPSRAPSRHLRWLVAPLPSRRATESLST